MTTDQIPALETLLAETESAHGEYEATELHGGYDDEWARWYAQYAVDHGIDKVLGRAITADELAGFLARSWDEAQRSDPKRSEPWPAYTARRIAAEL